MSDAEAPASPDTSICNESGEEGPASPEVSESEDNELDLTETNENTSKYNTPAATPNVMITQKRTSVINNDHSDNGELSDSDTDHNQSVYMDTHTGQSFLQSPINQSTKIRTQKSSDCSDEEGELSDDDDEGMIRSTRTSLNEKNVESDKEEGALSSDSEGLCSSDDEKRSIKKYTDKSMTVSTKDNLVASATSKRHFSGHQDEHGELDYEEEDEMTEPVSPKKEEEMVENKASPAKVQIIEIT